MPPATLGPAHRHKPPPRFPLPHQRMPDPNRPARLDFRIQQQQIRVLFSVNRTTDHIALVGHHRRPIFFYRITAPISVGPRHIATAHARTYRIHRDGNCPNRIIVIVHSHQHSRHFHLVLATAAAPRHSTKRVWNESIDGPRPSLSTQPRLDTQPLFVDSTLPPNSNTGPVAASTRGRIH